MTTMQPGDLTLYPVGEGAEALPRYDESRVLVRLRDPEAWTSDEWTETFDELSGQPVMVRRADCGAGCRCAGEVKLLSSRMVKVWTLTVNDGNVGITTVYGSEPAVYRSLRDNYFQDPDEPAPADDAALADALKQQGITFDTDEHTVEVSL